MMNNGELSITTYTDAKQTVYYKGKDISKALGYKNSNEAFRRHVNPEDKARLSELKVVVVHQRIKNEQPNTVYINERGVRRLVVKSRMPNAVDVAKLLGIEVENNKVLTKEQESISCIMKAFRGENMIFQNTVGDYRIDLYFPKYNLAIECDENGHKDRSLQKEIKRQKYLEETLNCHFIRYNPDLEGYDIFDVINQIFQFILKST